MQELSRRSVLVGVAAFTAGFPARLFAAGAPCCGPITRAGTRLAEVLDGMHVEWLWLADRHVNWETGEADGGAESKQLATHTHCSAFAAAAAKRLGVYLLRPPEHGQELLSNAQAEWLPGAEGRKAGWRAVRGAPEAQAQVNEGKLVVVVYRNPDAHRPGHVAIVRPSEKSSRTLEENGPEIAMAGQHNHEKTNTRIGFGNHPGAWPGGVRYFEHGL